MALVCVTLMYNVVRHTTRCVTLMWAHVEPVRTGVPFDSVLNLSAVVMVGVILRNIYQVHGRPPEVFSLKRRMTLLQTGDAPLTGLSFYCTQR